MKIKRSMHGSDVIALSFMDVLRLLVGKELSEPGLKVRIGGKS